MATPKKDLRRYPRADVKLVVEYHPDRSEGTNQAISHDLSASGVCFETDRTYEKGEKMVLKFHLPELNKVIPAKAYVVRSFEHEEKLLTAVEFTEIDYDDFLTILDYSLAFYTGEQP